MCGGRRKRIIVLGTMGPKISVAGTAARRPTVEPIKTVYSWGTWTLLVVVATVDLGSVVVEACLTGRRDPIWKSRGRDWSLRALDRSMVSSC